MFARYSLIASLLMAAYCGAQDLPPKHNPPPKEELSASEAMVHEVFKDEYARPAPQDRMAFSHKLLKTARESSNDPKVQFVLYREAAEFAAQTGDVATFVQATDEWSGLFTLNALALKSNGLLKMTPAVAKPDDALALAQACMALSTQAANEFDFDLALKLLNAAQSLSGRTKNLELPMLIQERVKTVRALQSDYAKVKEDIETLKTKPDDAGACLNVGRFLCLKKGSWDEGRALLVKGSSAALKTAATLELAQPKEAKDVFALAEAWWKAGEGEPLEARAAWQDHALSFYDTALPGLGGVDKALAEKRIAALRKPGAPLPHSALIRVPWETPVGGTVTMGPEISLQAPGKGIVTSALAILPLDVGSHFVLEGEFFRNGAYVGFVLGYAPKDQSYVSYYSMQTTNSDYFTHLGAARTQIDRNSQVWPESKWTPFQIIRKDKECSIIIDGKEQKITLPNDRLGPRIGLIAYYAFQIKVRNLRLTLPGIPAR